MPPLAWKPSSTSENTEIEPSAPPPLVQKYRIINLEDKEWDIHVFIQRETDSVMESDPQGRMSIFGTLGTIEEVGLKVLQNGKEKAACPVRNNVSISAGGTTGHSSCQDSR